MRLFYLGFLKIIISFGLYASLFTKLHFQQKIVIQRDIAEYKKQVIKNPNWKVISIKKYAPSIVVDLKYASKDNFMKQAVYTNAQAMLRKIALDKLMNVEAELNKKNIGLKIFDAYRPYRITQIMYRLSPNKNYVANPAKGSTHNRAITVDCTLIDITSKKELDMGTAFDDFTKRAAHGCTTVSKQAIANRKILRAAMEKYGFKALEKEWWHYGLHGATQYPLMDFNFEELENL